MDTALRLGTTDTPFLLSLFLIYTHTHTHNFSLSCSLSLLDTRTFTNTHFFPLFFFLPSLLKTKSFAKLQIFQKKKLNFHPRTPTLDPDGKKEQILFFWKISRMSKGLFYHSYFDIFLSNKRGLSHFQFVLIPVI